MTDVQEHLSPLQQIERAELERAFRDVFVLASGKRVLFWMLEQCAIYRDAYEGDNNATNYVLGQQSCGRRLIAKLDEIDPRFYPELLLGVADIRAMDKQAALTRAGTPENDDADE